jgi:ComF family protein
MSERGDTGEAGDIRSAGRRSGNRLSRGFSALADFLWAPVCIHCEAATDRSHGLCGRCWGQLAFIERPYCERLGTPFAVDLGAKLLSPAAIANPPAYGRARFVCRYDAIARRLVQRLKYGDRMELARFLGPMMARAGGEILAEAEAIVPIPLHRFRFWRRQFNQALTLGKAVAGQAGLPLEPDLLVRRKSTKSQVGLTRTERAANVTGAFKVPPEAKPRVEGRRIVIVDDVVTTGATVNAAANSLIRAGAASVDILAFARVVPET